MIKIEGLTKAYKNSKRNSIEDVSFCINDGEIFGFLGKNGAGKTTTLKCLTGLLPYEQGVINICGYDMAKEPNKAKLNIGYVPDNHAVFNNFTGKEYVVLMGNLYGVNKQDILKRIEKFALIFSMTKMMDMQIKNYSHGMKQKICIMGALIHEPKFWVLDEPLMGLDPQSAYEIKQYMLEHKSNGNAVFFSSHNIDMIEKLCDRVAILHKGKLLEILNVKDFIAKSEISLEEYFLNKTKD